MKIRLLVSFAALCGLAGGVPAQNAEEIVAKNLAARGGIAKMRAIQSLVVTAKLVTPDGGGGPMTVRVLRPDRIQEEMHFGNTIAIRTFDGKAAWVLNRDANREDIKALTGGDLENLRDEGANGIDGSLADYKEKGNKVEFSGAAVVEGRPCYKLKVTLRSGHVQYLFLDSQTFLEVHEEIVRTINGKETMIEETISDYRQEGGLLFAHKFVSGFAGDRKRSTLTFEKMELNAPLDPAAFHRPVAKKAAKAAKP
jgi:hypothetical protein